jgi:hypothetical protein
LRQLVGKPGGRPVRIMSANTIGTGDTASFDPKRPAHGKGTDNAGKCRVSVARCR